VRALSSESVNMNYNRITSHLLHTKYCNWSTRSPCRVHGVVVNWQSTSCRL